MRTGKSSGTTPEALGPRPLVFRSFLPLSPVRGSWGHAGDEWFVDLRR
jgi:hypothetical protein